MNDDLERWKIEAEVVCGLPEGYHLIECNGMYAIRPNPQPNQIATPITADQLARAAEDAERDVYGEYPDRRLISFDDVRWLARALRSLNIPVEDV